MAKSTQGADIVTLGGNNTFPTGSFGSAQVVKNAPGILATVVITTNSSAAVNIYDNASAASGTIIGVIPNNATAGQIYQFNMPANLGITIGTSGNTGAFTVGYF